MKNVVTGLGTGVILLCSGCAMYRPSGLGPAVASARARGSPILIYALGVPGQIEVRNNRTAVPVYIQFLVTGRQPIRRIRFLFAAYSQRGNPVLTGQGQRLEMSLTGPGKFNPAGNYEVNSFHSTPAGFPGGSVACVELKDVTLTFDDGRKQDFGPRTVSGIMMASLRHRCLDKGPRVTLFMTDSD